MEPIAFAVGVVGPLESLLRDVKSRFRNHRDALGLVDRISARFQFCDTSLSSLKRMLEQGWPKDFPQESEEICKKDLSTVCELLQSCEAQIEDLQKMQFIVDPRARWWRRCFSMSKRATRTNRVMEALTGLEYDSVSIENFARDLNSLLGLAYQAEKRTANTVQPSSSSYGGFVSIFKVPRPSGLEVQDFTSLETPEGELKQLLLHDSPSEQVTVALGVRVRKVPVPGIVGMGGVGKTSAMIGLGYEEDVRRRFPDGIHFLSLGQQAVASDVISGMARLVRDSGGELRAETIQSSEIVRDSVEEAARWFSGKACLFLCDDLWRTYERRQGFLPDIRHLLDTSSRSKMVISTRDLGIAGNTSRKVLFQPRNVQGETALGIFLSYAGIALFELESKGDETERLAYEILLICGGLPIALAVSGRLLGKYLDQASGNLPKALRICSKRLSSDNSEIMDTAVGTYSSFNATIRASLLFLEEDRLRSALPTSNSKEKTIPELFEALCVLKAQSRAPISMLQQLWGVSHDKALHIIDQFAGLSIISKHIEETHGESEMPDTSISAHDLVLAYSKELARRSGKEETWHRSLLDNYKCSPPGVHRDSVQNDCFGICTPPGPWWDVDEDGYIHKHIARHLMGSDSVSELGGLVTDMRWAKFRSREGGLPELENDIDVLLATLRNKRDPGHEANRLQRALKDFQILRKALRFSWVYMHENPHEWGFQLYSRLCQHQDGSEVIVRCLKSIEDWNEKPWMRPWSNNISAPDGRLVTEIGTRQCEVVSWTPDGKRAVYYDIWDGLVSFDLFRNEQEFQFETPEQQVPVSSLSCAGNGTCIASGSSDGTVRRWDLESRKQLGQTLRGHSDLVTSVAVSSDGQIVISGSNDRCVRLWQFNGDELVRNDYRKNRTSVFSVSISRNGRRALSSSSNIVTVWRTRAMQRIGTLRGHRGAVASVEISKNGHYAVTGSKDGSVRLWNLASEEQMGVPLFDSYEPVVGVSMSGDASRVAAFFVDNSARAWDLKTRTQIGTPFTQGSWCTEALNVDGTRMIMCSDNKITVCDVSDEGEKEDKMLAHSGPVVSLAYCQKTGTIASISNDGTAVFWDANTGLRSGEPFCLNSVHDTPYDVALSGNGTKLAVAFLSGNTHVWDVHTRAMTVKAGREIRDCLKRKRYRPFQVGPSNMGELARSLEIQVLGKQVFHVTQNENQAVATLKDDVASKAWAFYRDSHGELVMVVGDKSGKVLWFTLEK